MNINLMIWEFTYEKGPLFLFIKALYLVEGKPGVMSTSIPGMKPSGAEANSSSFPSNTSSHCSRVRSTACSRGEHTGSSVIKVQA